MIEDEIRLLREVEGLTVREIAERTGLSKSAVHRRLRKFYQAGYEFPQDVKFERRKLEQTIKTLGSATRIWDILGDRLLEAAGSLKPLAVYDPPPANKHKLADEDFVHVLSDIHAGAKIDPLATGGLTEYDSAILRKRLEFYKTSCRDILRYHANPPKVGRIFLLGDLIEGSTIFFGQQRAIDQNTVEQVFFVVDCLAEAINFLTSLYEEVHVYGVPGNHGRIGQKGQNHPMDNFDYLAYRWIQERLKDNERVECKFAESWFQLVEIRGHKFLLLHGDTVAHSYLGIPFYGARTSFQNWQNLLHKLSKSVGGFDYMVMGHHHENASFGGVIMNGSFVGPSEYSLRRMTRGEPPFQAMFAVHDTYGVTWQRNVILESPRSADIKVFE